MSATIVDIAKAAGVSVSTVSRVMNHNQNVAADLREKVQEAAKRLNYVPNQAARSLVTQSNKNIGMLVADIRKTAHSSSIYEVERLLENAGYFPSILNVGIRPEEKAEAIEKLATRNPTAVIMFGVSFQNVQVKKAIKKHLPNVPIVINNGYLDLPNVYGLVSEFSVSADTVVNYLFSKEYRHIGIISPGMNEVDLKREKILSETLKRRNQHWTVPMLTVQTEAEIETQTEQVRQFLLQNTEMDGLIVLTDLQSAMAVNAARQLNKKIGTEFGIVSMSDSLICKVISPSITALQSVSVGMALLAGTTLLNVLEGKEALHKVMVETNDIAERDSTTR